jgi:serine protease Do
MLRRAASRIPAHAGRPGALLAAFAAAILIMPTPDARADSRVSAAAIHSHIQQLFEQHRAAVVRVRASDNLGVRLGNGFFIDPAGTVYTHAGIVLKAEEVTIDHCGRVMPATVLAADERSGIALLKTDCQSPFLPVGDCSRMTPSTPVIALGYPEDREIIPAMGLITSRDRQHLGRYFTTPHLRANIPLQRGEGGAPVIDLDGRVVGIVVSRLDDGTACHLLPIAAAEKVRHELKRFGSLRPGYVGVEVEDADDPVHGSTARIRKFRTASAGQQAGLHTGDIILRIGDFPVTGTEDVIEAAYFLTAGESSEIEVARKGRRITFPFEPAIHPNAVPGSERIDLTITPPQPSPALTLDD